MTEGQAPIWTPPPETHVVTKQVLKSRFSTSFAVWIVVEMFLHFSEWFAELSKLRLVSLAIGAFLFIAALLCHFFERPRQVTERKFKKGNFHPPVIH